jgi:hypothetical protein
MIELTDWEFVFIIDKLQAPFHTIHTQQTKPPVIGETLIFNKMSSYFPGLYMVAGRRLRFPRWWIVKETQGKRVLFIEKTPEKTDNLKHTYFDYRY